MLSTTNIHIGNLDLLDLENKLNKASEQLEDNQYLTLDVGNMIENDEVTFFIKICFIDEFEIDYIFKEYNIKNILNATGLDCVTLVNELMYMTRNMVIDSYRTKINEIFNQIDKEFNMNKINKSNKKGIITIYVEDFNHDDWKDICGELGLCPHETQQVELHVRHSISSGDGFKHEIEEYDRVNQKSALDYHLELI